LTAIGLATTRQYLVGSNTALESSLAVDNKDIILTLLPRRSGGIAEIKEKCTDDAPKARQCPPDNQTQGKGKIKCPKVAQGKQMTLGLSRLVGIPEPIAELGGTREYGGE
jgi:hypothetical protein